MSDESAAYWRNRCAALEHYWAEVDARRNAIARIYDTLVDEVADRLDAAHAGECTAERALAHLREALDDFRRAYHAVLDETS